MQQVRDGMVARNGRAAGGVHGERNGRPDVGRVALREEMEPCRAGLLRGDDVPKRAAALDLAGIADLPAHLGVASGDIENDSGLPLHLDDVEDGGQCAEGIIPDKLGRLGVDVGDADDLALLGGTGAVALLFHQLFKTRFIHGEAAFAGQQFGEVERETVGVVE